VQQRTPSEVLGLAKSEGVEIVDLRFCDLPGLMQHFSVPVSQLTEDAFEDGYGFDGSSIRGFQEIQESDMLLFPDPNTAVIDPFRTAKTLNINCFVRDPVTAEPYSRDPRYVAQKAEAYLISTGVADTALTTCGSTTTSTPPASPSTRSKGTGTQRGTRDPTSATRSATRRGTSPSRPWTTSRICGPR